MKLSLLLVPGLCLALAACNHHSDAPSSSPAAPVIDDQTPTVSPTGEVNPTVAKIIADDHTPLNTTDPYGQSLSRETLYDGPGARPCKPTDGVLMLKTSVSLIQNIQLADADLTRDNGGGQPSRGDVADADQRTGDAILACNQFRATVDTSACTEPTIVSNLPKFNENCDRLPELKSKIAEIQDLQSILRLLGR